MLKLTPGKLQPIADNQTWLMSLRDDWEHVRSESPLPNFVDRQFDELEELLSKSFLSELEAMRGNELIVSLSKRLDKVPRVFVHGYLI